MKISNGILEVIIDDDSGYVIGIYAVKDRYRMNFISEGGQFGSLNQKWRHFDQEFETVEVDMLRSEECVHNMYANDRIHADLQMGFTQRGAFYMRYTFSNRTFVPVCISRDTLGIAVPFNDRYTYAEECLTRRCHTHIHTGGSSSWINALRMGVSEYNLGLVLTRGSVVSYSQYDCKTNCRGSFELEPETVIIEPEGKYQLEWEIFLHHGNNFFEKLREYDSFIDIRAEHYTLFLGETARFTVSSGLPDEPKVTFSGKNLRQKA